LSPLHGDAPIPDGVLDSRFEDLEAGGGSVFRKVVSAMMFYDLQCTKSLFEAISRAR
jgi:hypothetical protein